jgi:hypothetical protein
MRILAHAWSAPDVVGALVRCGFDDAHEVPRTWAAPIRFVVARQRRAGA